MSKDTKLLYVQIIADKTTPDDIKAVSDMFAKVKEKLPFDIEFIISNDQVQLRDVKYLMTELYKLYKEVKKDGKHKSEGKLQDKK